LDGFEKDVREATGALVDFESIGNKIKTIFSTLENLKLGDIVDTQVYDEIIDLGLSMGESWEDFFIITATGEKKFIGNMKRMQEAASNALLEDLAVAKRE
jgi:hypothetical protein